MIMEIRCGWKMLFFHQEKPSVITNLVRYDNSADGRAVGVRANIVATHQIHLSDSSRSAIRPRTRATCSSSVPSGEITTRVAGQFQESAHGRRREEATPRRMRRI